MSKKFNVLDVVILLFVICLIGFLAVRFTTAGSYISHSQETAEYEIAVKDIKKVTSDAIPESGAIFDDTGASMGNIVSKSISNARVLLQKEDGSYDIVENTQKYDVTVKAVVSGVQKTEGFFFEGKKSFGVGSTVFVNAGNISFQGIIMSMEVK